jgi:uncharacterized protein YecT (DUF1311 family)
LAWWFGSAPDRALTRQHAADISAARSIPPVQTRTYAPRKPSEEQIRRAYDQVRDVYADSGSEGLARFSRTCADSVRADARVLDYCLAFDLYASALPLAPGSGPSGLLSDAERVELAAGALPEGVDAAARIRAVEGLSGVRPAAVKVARSKEQREVQAAAKSSRPKTAKAAQAAPRRASTTGPCRLKSTPADRAICANASLQAADRRMRAAYQRAVNAGANPRTLAREQARWRVELNAAASNPRRTAALLEERTRQLRAEAARTRR